MKKLLVLFGCLLSAGAVLASTCETRVDKKWDKTTQDRVNTCLFGDDEVDGPQTEVVSSLIYSTYPPTQKKQKASKTDTIKYKRYNEEESYRELIDQDYYPTFKNDFFPEQSDELAHETAIEALREHRQTVAQQEALEAVIARQQEQYAKELARSKKSKTKKKSKTASITMPEIQSDEISTVSTTEQTSQAVSLPDHETTDTLTAAPALETLNQPPTGEVEQAQAIEQDPLAPLAEDDPMKELSLNEDLLGPSGFGYNDTDPAFQQ